VFDSVQLDGTNVVCQSGYYVMLHSIDWVLQFVRDDQ
jgi:hypothetical protein